MKDRLPSSAGLFDLLETDVAAFDALRKAESIGRPVGDEAFLDRIAKQTGKAVKPQKRGQRRKEISTLSPQFGVERLLLVLHLPVALGDCGKVIAQPLHGASDWRPLRVLRRIAGIEPPLASGKGDDVDHWRFPLDWL